MKQLRTFKFTNENGRSVTIGEEPFFLTDFSTPMDSRAQTSETPEKDGRVTLGVWRGHRITIIDGVILAKTNAELDRLKIELGAAFDTKFFGDLIFTAANSQYHLRCRAVSQPALKREDSGGSAYRFSVALESDEPYFTEYPERRIEAGASYLNHRFPWFLPAGGTPMSILYTDTIVENTSDLNVYPIIEITDTKGATVHITNDATGAFLRILKAVKENQKMVVDTERRSVWLYEKTDGKWEAVQSVQRWLSLDSEMGEFYLVPGINSINVNEDLPTGKPTTIIRYSIPAVGV